MTDTQNLKSKNDLIKLIKIEILGDWFIKIQWPHLTHKISKNIQIPDNG